MPKVRRARSPSIDSSRSYPYPSNSKNVEPQKPMNMSGSVNEMKEWEDVRCPICMEHPHNVVLLKCSSHEMGCRPYMCNTSYRHSNCLDQFCKSFASHLSSAILEEIPLTSSASHDRGVQSEPGQSSQCGSELKPKLLCPLCRGDIYGYMVSEPARMYMNSKLRSCSSETCEFQGTYSELRKHARSEHPFVRPSEVDPTRQCDWLRMEQERDMEDLFSTFHTSSGGLADLMSLFLYEIFSSIEDASRMASLLVSSRPRVPLHDRSPGTMHRVSNDAQENLSSRWRSNLPSPHQQEMIHRGRWRSNFSSSSSLQNLEASRTARWRTNSNSNSTSSSRMARWRTSSNSNSNSNSNSTSSSRMARWRTNSNSNSNSNSTSSSRMTRDVGHHYSELCPGVTSSARMSQASHVPQSNPQSNVSSSGRNRGRQLHWRDPRWSTYNNQP